MIQMQVAQHDFADIAKTNPKLGDLERQLVLTMGG